jgi:C-lobe and N-lobe beta barrels of Tf-binding protein B
LINLTSSENFVNDASTGTASFPKTGAPPTTSASQTAATVAYDLVTKGYTITVGGRSLAFLPSDIDAAQSNAGVAVYVKKNGTTTDSLTLTKPGTSGRFNYEFVGGGFWQRTTDGATTISGSFDAFAYGLKTPDAAVPRTGRAEYAVDLLGVETISDNVFGLTGQGTTQVDFGSGTLVTHGTIGAAINGATTFSSEARLSSSANSFSGNFRFSDFGEFNGTLNGRFYGPNAQEIGAAFSASQADGRVAVGAIIGRGAPVTSTNADMKTLTVNEFFPADGSKLTATLAGNSGYNNGTETFSARDQTGTIVVVNYDAATRSYTLIGADRSQYFPDNRDRNRGAITERFTSTTPVNGPGGFPYATFTGLKYATSGQWFTAKGVGGGTEYVIEDIVYGKVTPNSALPRTGSAGFAIGLSGTAADSDFVNLAKIGGFGFLTVDFAAGSITTSGSIGFSEDYFIAGRAAKLLAGNFSGTGSLSSNANAFSGTFNFDGLGPYSGTMNGRFFGPAADEVGATWRATDGTGGVASGTFVGGRDAAATNTVKGLKDLTAPTDLAFSAVRTSNSAGDVTQVNYDPATQTFRFSFTDTALLGAPTRVVALSPASQAAGGTASYAAYAGSGADFSYTAKLLVPSATNPTLALTYASLADISRLTNAANFTSSTRDVVPFGVPTPILVMPRSGSGTFSGTALGTGTVTVRTANGSTSNSYDLSGTSLLRADFFASSFSAQLNLNGVNSVGGGALAFSPYNFNGTITGNGFSTANNGMTFAGQFYGPAANEFGAYFKVLDTAIGAGLGDTTLTDLVGATVGRRCPGAGAC